MCVCFLGVSDGKESACNAWGSGLIPGLGRSPGEGNGNPLQCSCLENFMQRILAGTVHGVVKSQTQLSDYSTVQDCALSAGSRKKLFPWLFQLLVWLTFLGSWPLPISPKPAGKHLHISLTNTDSSASLLSLVRPLLRTVSPCRNPEQSPHLKVNWLAVLTLFKSPLIPLY